jgi:OOP family OmpA-OmpF porin
VAQFHRAASAAGEAHRFELIGHTDDEGSAEKNAQLGLDRALSVKAALGTLAIDSNAFSVRSAGSREPLHPSEPGRPQPLNRSVTIRVIQ